MALEYHCSAKLASLYANSAMFKTLELVTLETTLEGNESNSNKIKN